LKMLSIRLINMIEIKDNFILIKTKTTSLIFEVRDFLDESTPFYKNKRFITQYYYGFTKDEPELVNTVNNLPGRGSCNDYNVNPLISSSYGNGNNLEPLLLLKNSDGTYINRFFYKGYKVIEGAKDIEGPHARKVSKTLVISEYDEVLNIELNHYYSIFEDSDVIVSKKEVVNHSSKPFNIERLFSLELPIKCNELDVASFDGSWLFERTRHISKVTNGVFTIDSKIGSSSNKHNPYIEVTIPENENQIMAFNFIYSANHKEMVEVNPLGYSKVMVGISDFGFDYEVKAKESFITPEAIFTLKENKDELIKEMHSFTNGHIINPNFVGKSRPVLFNNWEGTGMKIDEKSLLDMAVIAKKVGVEQFVVDDGWFINRITDNGGLGDWTIDKNKFPDGLLPFVNKVRDLGLKFGIWIEPEMICINTDLFKVHPEYASIIPSRDPLERRHQLMIDMSNKEVVDYLFNSLSKVFDEIKPDYIKWDFNRYHTDMYSLANFKAGEFLHRWMMGSYDLFDRLTKRYPNTLFEGCASGGGRFDLGILYYTPQTWGSDDTNTYCRSFITCGTLTMYPQSTFGAHVSRDYCPKEDRNARSSLEDRFNLNSIGAFGYEFDFRTFEEKELNIMAKQIEYYKAHRELLSCGTFYINKNIFDDNRYFSFNVVSKDKKEAILFIEETERNIPSLSWKVKGLDENKTYEVTQREQYNLKPFEKRIYKGKELIEKGIDIGSLDTTSDADLYPLGVFTRLFYIKEI